mgnify:FL=1
MSVTADEFRCAAGRGTRMDLQLLSTASAYIPVNGTDELGYTALHYTCRSKSLLQGDMAQILLDRGANPNVQTAHKVTPLHLCCLGSSDEKVLKIKSQIIHELLQHGADPLTRDHSGVLPLHLAASAGMVNGVRLLIKATVQVGRVQWWKGGKDKVFQCPYVRMCDRFGKRAYDWALDRDQKATMRLLFLCEYGYAFAMLYQQLRQGKQVSTDAIQTLLALSSSDMVTIEQYLRKECGFKTQHELDAESGENTFEGSSFHSTEERDLLMAEFDELMHQAPHTGNGNNANDIIEGEGSNHIQMDEEHLSGLYNEFIDTATFLVGR